MQKTEDRLTSFIGIAFLKRIRKKTIQRKFVWSMNLSKVHVHVLNFTEKLNINVNVKFLRDLT